MTFPGQPKGAGCMQGWSPKSDALQNFSPKPSVCTGSYGATKELQEVEQEKTRSNPSERR